MRIQRFITDFGAEHSFEMSVKKMQEHHPLAIVPASSAREIVQTHARKASQHLPAIFLDCKDSKQMIIEMDGEMIPTISFKPGKDKRKNRRVSWEELRVGVAQNKGDSDWKYASSFESADQVGERLRQVMVALGFTDKTKVHCVADAAFWILNQAEKIAGSNLTYLVDMFHLCEYFFNAFEGLRLDPKAEMLSLKQDMEEGNLKKVIEKLKREQEIAPNHEGLRACIRYISNRPGQFDYLGARKKELPIGSGKVESTHRSLIQRRLKIPGAWWKRENADAMANLRTLRANGGWELLWNRK